MVEETVTVNPDGSTTFEGAEDAAGGAEEAFEETFEEVIEAGIDPALYLLVGFVVAVVLYFLFLRKNKNDQDDYFSSYEKVSMMCWKKVIENENPFSTLKKASVDECLSHCSSAKPKSHPETFLLFFLFFSSISSSLPRSMNTTLSKKNV